MGNPRIGLLACAFACAGMFVVAEACGAAALFDKPLKVVRTALPRDRDNPDAKPEVRCSYYVHFMVKEVDLGEIGADQLSILPAKEDRPCRKENARDEKVLSADDWTGYFKGVAGNYIFFDAEDGWNGGTGFAVFTPNAKKLFDDVAKDWFSIGMLPLPPPAGVAGRALALRYVRVYGAKCSLGDEHAKACWKSIEQQTGLDAPKPDCRELYVREQRRTPKLAREVLGDPAAVEYEVSTTLAMNGTHITALSGRAPSCTPQE